MRYLSQKEIVKIAEIQNKLTEELRALIDKYYARYRLRIISEAEFFKLLAIKR